MLTYKEGITYGNGNLLIKAIQGSDIHTWGLFKCVCGTEFEARIYTVVKRKIRGCNNCYKRGRPITHNLGYHKLYRIYKAIISRCYNKQDRRYRDWGGRGITMSKEFLNSMKVFIQYIESLPNYENRERDKLSIDRIENNGNYERGNLKWSTPKEQANNRRDNIVK